jgi:hypothetical protein
MPQPYKAQFDKNGRRCPRNLQKQKRLPECGVFDRREFVPQNRPYVPPIPPGPQRKFDPFAPGQTIPRRFPQGSIPDVPDDPPGVMPGISPEDSMGGGYPQDMFYPLPDGFGGREHMETLVFHNPTTHPLVRQYAQIPPRGYTRIPDLGDYDMEAFREVTERAPRTRLYERTSFSSDNLRRRLVRDSYTPDSNFTGRQGQQHLLQNPIDDFSDEFSQPLRQSRLPQPRGTPSYPAQDIEEGILDPYGGPERQLLRPTARRNQTLRLMERARARTTSFAQNRAAVAAENARTLARNLAETASNVQTDMTRAFATQYRRGYMNIGARAAATTGVDLPEFDVDAQINRPQVQPEPSAFRDGTFDIEQGLPEGPDATAMEGRSFASRVTGLRGQETLDIMGADRPFDVTNLQDAQAGRQTFAERLQEVGASRSGQIASAGAHAIGGAGVGLLAGYGVANLMGKAGADPYSTAFVSSASGDVASRWAAIGAQSMTRVAAQRLGIAAGEEVTENIAKTLAISGLRGTAEGGLAGLALAPVDIALNQAFLNAGMNHADSGAAASGITGAAFLGGVGAVSLATAPETLGLSLAVGAVVAGIGTLVSWITGHNQDEEEKKKRQERQRKIDKINNANNERKVLISLLPTSNYSLASAQANFKRIYGDAAYAKLGVGDDTWSAFSQNVTEMFTDGPPPHAQKGGKEPTGDDKKMNDYYAKYVAHSVITQICAGRATCALASEDPGALSSSESKFLDDKAGPVWRSQADLAASMTVGQANFHHQMMANAQQTLIDGWNNERKLPQDYDPSVLRDAEYDTTFIARYNAAIEADAQRDIIQSYISSGGQTTIDKQPANIQQAALMDPTFRAKYDTYISQMNSTAVNLNVTVGQLIELQALGNNPSQQTAKYREFQFNNAKENVNVVSQAQGIMKEETQIKQLGFYDIDSAFLQTDPTDIGEWHPTDAQIIQASRAGMTLQQYVDYLTELQKGDSGDFSKLPSYTDAQLTAMGELDYKHLQDDLQLAGYSADYYLYDPVTRTYRINPHAATVPNPKLAAAYQSQYTPEYLLEAREEYAKMITSMNNNFKHSADAYNKALASQVAADAHAYQAQVEAYNIILSQQSTAAYTPLMSLDAQSIYNANMMQYHPLSTTMPGRQLTDDTKDEKDKDGNVQVFDHHGQQIGAANSSLSAKQLAEIANAKKMGYVGDDERILDDYIATKNALEAQGIKNPTQAQVDTAYNHIKQQKNRQSDPFGVKNAMQNMGQDATGGLLGKVGKDLNLSQLPGTQTGYKVNPDGSLERVVRKLNQDGTVQSTTDVGAVKPSTSQSTTGSNLQRDFRAANPNLNPRTTFTDNQVKTLNKGGQVTGSDGQQYASS